MENDSKKVATKCLVCESKTAGFWARKNNCDLYRCRSCGLVFVYPSPHNLRTLYSADYFTGARAGFGYVDYEHDRNATSVNFETYLDEIGKLVSRPGRLLDIGAATGTFMELAARCGWQARGVEISSYAAAKAREKGLDVATGTVEDAQFDRGFFDVVTMWDVLEHLPDPERTMREVQRLLRPGGLVALNTPNAGSAIAKIMGRRWHLIVPPEHLYYFSIGSATRLFSRLGFTVCRTGSIGKKFTLQFVFMTLARWQKLFLWRWIAKVLQGTQLGQFSVPVNLHDNFFMVARKSRT